MERKFYPENFEKFLKGHADQFKMTPSKKVWHGIYNDLHPGRRWPSIAISMVFIFTLVIIGHLNTNNGNNTSLHDLTSLQTSNPVKSAKTSATFKRIKSSYIKDIVTGNNLNENTSDDNDPVNTAPLLSVIKNIEPSSNTESGLSNKNEIPSSAKIESDVTKTYGDNEVTKSLQQDANQIKSDKEAVNTTPTDKEISSPGKEIIPQIAQANASNISKPRRINNVTWTYYVTPSISYRYIAHGKMDDYVTHKPMLGYEAGTAMSFNLYKKLQFTTGLQLNYSGYNIRANNTHPIVASLILNSSTAGQQYEVYSTMSHYGNRTGTEFSRLKNYSLQASLPIGLQYAFAGNESIKLSAAATFQPSFIIANKSYLLSEDKRNYLTNADLLRKWNMNSSLTTYVSFSSNSYNWQIGPQVRYQLLSTYTNRYRLKENYINYGIRIGISNITK